MAPFKGEGYLEVGHRVFLSEQRYVGDRKNSRGDELLLYEAKKHLFREQTRKNSRHRVTLRREKYSSRVFTAFQESKALCALCNWWTVERIKRNRRDNLKIS